MNSTYHLQKSKFSMKLIPSILLLSAAPMAMGQQLKQEVNVEHEVVPVHREFSPLRQSPTLNLPQLAVSPLEYSSRMSAAKIDPNAPVYDPAAWGDTLATTPWRGYATIGYWPAYHVDGSAGYRLIDADRTRLAAWGQLNGINYKAGTHEHRRTQTAVGLDLRQAIGRLSYIDASAVYRFAYFNVPRTYMDIIHGPIYQSWTQYANNVGLSAAWHSSERLLKYNIGANYSYFGFYNKLASRAWEKASSLDALLPAREHVAGVNGDARMALTDNSTVGADAAFTFVHDSQSAEATYMFPEDYWQLNRRGSYNHALVTLIPKYLYNSDKFSANIGVRLDAGFNSGTVLQIAPDLKVSWQPTSMLRLTATATGERKVNTLESMFDVNYLMTSSMTYKDSRVPYDVNASILIGPRKAIWGEIFGGYAKAKDWLMPQFSGVNSFFAPQTIAGWHSGLRVGAILCKAASFEGSVETASQGYTKGYYLWRDRAKYVAHASLTVRPIKPLEVTADYELRARRAVIFNQNEYVPSPDSKSYYWDLGNKSDINIAAKYSFSDRLTFFTTLNNLLNRHQYTISGIEAEGFNGLVGASYKF